MKIIRCKIKDDKIQRRANGGPNVMPAPMSSLLFEVCIGKIVFPSKKSLVGFTSAATRFANGFGTLSYQWR